MADGAAGNTIYGWRGKIGIVVPSNNTVIEPELWTMRPPGVTIHATRVLSHGNSPEGIVKMEESAMRAAQKLGAGAMSVIAYACLATSLVKGPVWNDEFAGRIKSESGIPATTAATATRDALRSFGANTIAIANAYPARLNALVRGYFEAESFRVASLESLDVENSLELWRLSVETIHALGRRAMRADVDALCIIATDLPTISVIEMLESEIGIPVVTTNQALLWQCLRLMGLNSEMHGFGRLLREAAKSTAVESRHVG